MNEDFDDRSNDIFGDTGPNRSANRTRLSGFDRFCAVTSFGLGIVLLILGALGLFVGCSANFTLPPVLGILPALVGWGIVKAIYVAWKVR